MSGMLWPCGEWPGDFEKSRKVTAGYWRDTESYPKRSGDPFQEFKPENSKICLYIYLEGHFFQMKRGKEGNVAIRK